MSTTTKCILIMTLAVVAGAVMATRAAARALPRAVVGRGIAIAGDEFFPPWSVIEWQLQWGARYPRSFTRPHALLAAHAAGGALLVAGVRAAFPPLRPVGRGKWATARDVRHAGLFAGTGIVLGRLGRRLLVFGGPEHVLSVGATRSGKGVGLVVTTLLSDLGSAVILDIKGELWAITAGWRSRSSRCLRFDPTCAHSARFNPLAEIRKGPNEVRDAQSVAELLIDPGGSRSSFDVWELHSKQLVTAVILHVLYSEPDDRKHLAAVRERILDHKRTLRDMIELPHRLHPRTGRPQSHPEIARVARELLAQAPKFVAGVIATAQSYLTLFADEIVVRNTSASDFTIGDLVCGDRPVSLYLQIPPSDLARLRPLVRILLNQVTRGLLEHLQTDSRGRPKKHALLLELDEFASLGRLDFLAASLRQMAGYGIRAHIIVQAFNDLIEIYGPHQSITDNCHVTTVFACGDTVTQQRVSQLTGTSVEYRDSFAHRRWPGLAPDSLQKGEQVRPLLQPGEVRTLSADEQLIFVTGHPPIRAGKTRYFKDRRFRRRVLPPPHRSTPIDSLGARWISPALGIAHDWIGERAKGERIPCDDIFDGSHLDDENWIPVAAPDPPKTAPADQQRDDYAL